MKRLIALVEGPGDVAAVPVLLRMLLQQATLFEWQPGDPMKVNGLAHLRKRLPSFAEALRIKMHEGKCHGVLVLLDLEDGCPRDEARALAAEFAAYGLPYPVSIVFAHREYEEWLVASLPTIAPRTFLLANELVRDYPAESKRGVKEWLTSKMPRGAIYKETTHQEEFTRSLDATLAAQCRSFRRLVHALSELTNLATSQTRGSATPV